MDFVRGGDTCGEPPASYDAVMGMAVFRHGDLAKRPPSSEPKLTFASFDNTLRNLARCVKPGGYLAIEHANFLFTDASVGPGFRCILDRKRTEADVRTPVYGRENLLMEPQPTSVGILFEKLRP